MLLANANTDDEARATSCRNRSTRLTAFLVIWSCALFAVAATRRHPFLDGCNVESSNCHASIIIEPYDHAGAPWVKTGVIGAGNAISRAAAGNDRERLKWSCF